MKCPRFESVKVAIKSSFCLCPSGWRTLHHSLLGNNSHPPTTELVRGRLTLRHREGGGKEAGAPPGGALTGNERGRKILTCFGCGSVCEGEGRVNYTCLVVSGYSVHVCVGPAAVISTSPLICWVQWLSYDIKKKLSNVQEHFGIDHSSFKKPS